jgi:type II secretory pathway predicted ATPase ExeA
MRIGYARVSTDDQTLDLQRDALKRAKCRQVYEEHASGKTTIRPELEACLKSLRKGETLVVWRLDRLGRSLGDLINLTTELRSRGVDFESLTERIETGSSAGKLIFIVGCGKTTMLRRIQEALSQDKEILASKSLSLEKSQISLATLIMALFYDLATEKDFKIPTQPERRERALRDLIKKRQKPIALFIDDAHDLHSKTLIGLKRLIEVIRDSGGMLSVVLAGHPKLKNDLRRSSMEEIGSRATIFELEGLGHEKRKYLKWLLAQSVAPKTKIENVITDDAVAMLSEKLSTPLQFEYYLTRALEEAYKVGQKPIGADMIENVLAKDINGLEPRLTRQGYNAKVLAELLNAKPREIKSFLSGQLASGRSQELQSELLAAGIPL